MFDRNSKRRFIRLGFAALLIVVSITTMSLSSVNRAVKAQGDVLLNDQFTDNSNNWELAIGTSDNSAMKIGDGVLSLALKKTGTSDWAMPDMTFPNDITAEVELATTVKPSKGDWGAALAIRSDTRDTKGSFYLFEVTGLGEWRFVTSTPDSTDVQKSGKLKDWDPTATNKLKVQVEGNSFTYWVNDQKVGVFEDDSINSDPSTDRYAGLFLATSKDAPKVTVEFSNFTITGAGSGVDATPVKATPVASNGSALLEENFPDDNPNKWGVGKTTNGSAKVQDNSLIIELHKKNVILWSIPATLFPQDIDITATMINTAPDVSGDWSYGIGLRGYSEGDQDYFYLFSISGTGKWQFEKMNGADGLQEIVKPTALKTTFHAKEENTLRATVVGSHFTFYLNGKKVGEADDDSLAQQDEYKIVLSVVTNTSSKISTTFTDVSVEPAS